MAVARDATGGQEVVESLRGMGIEALVEKDRTGTLSSAEGEEDWLSHRRLAGVADLMAEVRRFRAWADATCPPDRRFGEWECDYQEWDSLYGAVLEFVAARPFESWSPEELRAVLFAVARDNEMEHLASEVRRRHPDLLAPLTRESIAVGEWADRWQSAEELGWLGRAGGEEERLLLVLARDEHEYVRRRVSVAVRK